MKLTPEEIRSRFEIVEHGPLSFERSIGAFSVRAAIRSHFQLPEKP